MFFSVNCKCNTQLILYKGTTIYETRFNLI